MTNHDAYHLKELVWFHGWTPSHWVLIAEDETLKARCTWAGAQPGENVRIQYEQIPVSTEIFERIERTIPGSIPAIMGFDFVICEGEPGKTILNKSLNFAVPQVERSLLLTH